MPRLSKQSPPALRSGQFSIELNILKVEGKGKLPLDNHRTQYQQQLPKTEMAYYLLAIML